MPRPASFGQWIKQRRKALDLTQAALAQQAHCSLSAIEKIEADRRRPARTLAEQLADVLAIDPADRQAFLQAARGIAEPAEALPPSNLPTPATQFIGREHESSALRALLREPQVRLLSLTGTGGIGKTRLALHVAADVRAEFTDGTTFIPLATLRDPTLVAATIARAVGMHDSGTQPIAEQLQHWLREQQRLLVLDNFEHLLAAAPLLATLLAAAPRLKLLVTSRAALQLGDEHEFSVPPLPLPNRRRLPSLLVLAQNAAVALFLARSQAARPDFALARENAGAVVEVCAQVDGLPLAIELAAARIRLFTPQQVLERLSSRLQLLTGGARDQHPRQQTLRATLDWSYALLTPDEQALFARLAVFVGGCTVEAAEAICAAVHERIVDVVNGLSTLLDQHLVQHKLTSTDEPHLFLLETLREYALEHLEQNGELEAVQKQHVEYYLALAETAYTAMRGPEQQRWLNRLDREHDNMRLALEWALSREESVTAARLAGALRRFWQVRGYLSEGRVWLARTIAQSHTIATPLHTALLTGAGVLAWEQADGVQAIQLHQEALRLSRQAGNKRDASVSLLNLGVITVTQRDYKQAQSLFEESLAIDRELGDTSGMAIVLNNLAVCALYQGNWGQARKLAQESLLLREAVGDKSGSIFNLNIIGETAFYQSDYGQAHIFFTKALQLAQELGYKQQIGYEWINLARVALEREEYTQATQLCQESLVLHHEVNDQERVAECFEVLAHIAGVTAHSHQAARLYGVAHALRNAINAPLLSIDQPLYEHYFAIAQAQVDPQIFAAAWAAGQTLPVEAAVEYALDSQSQLDCGFEG